MSSEKKLKTFGETVTLPKPSKKIEIENRFGPWKIALIPNKDGRVMRVRFCAIQSKGKFYAKAGSETFFGEVITPSFGGGADSGASGSEYTSQFPGKVRKVLVSDGSLVKKGDALLVVEAMKMEFQIKAHADGTVQKVFVKENDQLSPGAKFLEFETKK